MNCFQSFLKLKIFGASSLILASVYIIIYNIDDKNFYQHLSWAFIILLFVLLQFYNSFFLERNPQLPLKEELKDKNEVNPLIKEKYPMIRLHVKEIEGFNNELEILKKDEDPEYHKLFFNLKNNINNIFINLIKIKIFYFI